MFLPRKKRLGGGLLAGGTACAAAARAVRPSVAARAQRALAAARVPPNDAQLLDDFQTMRTIRSNHLLLYATGSHKISDRELVRERD